MRSFFSDSHKPFAIFSAMIVVLFLGAMAYVWASFGAYLLGIPSTRGEAAILAPIDERRYELLMDRYERRRSLVDPAAGLRSPFRPSAIPETPSSIQ